MKAYSQKKRKKKKKGFEIKIKPYGFMWLSNQYLMFITSCP